MHNFHLGFHPVGDGPTVMGVVTPLVSVVCGVTLYTVSRHSLTTDSLTEGREDYTQSVSKCRGDLP